MLELVPILLGLLTLSATPDIPDVTTLTPSQRAVYQGVIAEEFCSCDSAMTIGGCLELRPSCGVARHFGDIAYTAAQSGNTTDEVLGFLAEQVIGPFCRKASPLTVPKAPSFGKSSASVTIVEFADFRCGHCKAHARWPITRGNLIGPLRFKRARLLVCEKVRPFTHPPK